MKYRPSLDSELFKNSRTYFDMWIGEDWTRQHKHNLGDLLHCHDSALLYERVTSKKLSIKPLEGGTEH